MRKNKVAFKNLDLYTTYEIKGINLDALLNTLIKKGVYLKDVKKIDSKTLIISVKFYQNEKFFAITKDLCYTDIRKIKDGGKSYPILFLLRNMGLIFGGLFFILLSIFSGDYIYSFSYSGNGKIMKREVQNFLSSKGITQMSRFSDIDLASLSDEILSFSPRLSFVECQKVGNRLNVELALSNGTEKILEGNKTELLTDYDGVVESVKVYRGTALVKVGDAVKKGDKLVSGTVVVKEREIDVGVIATINLRVSYNFEYISERDGEEDIAETLAENALNIKDAKITVQKSSADGKYIYRVTLESVKVLFTG